MKTRGVQLITVMAILGCVSADDPNRRTKQGAAVGAAAGAVAGAVVGNQSGNPRTGAAVGAAVGAGVGAAIGHKMDKQQQELERIEGIDVTRTAEDELNVVVRNEILFDHDSAALRSASRASLQEMAGVFSRYPETRITVAGHADSTGPDAYNHDLSHRRARAVRDYLADQGVAASRIEAIGSGETQQRATNDTPEGRQLNRRVEIRVKATG